MFERLLRGKSLKWKALVGLNILILLSGLSYVAQGISVESVAFVSIGLFNLTLGVFGLGKVVREFSTLREYMNYILTINIASAIAVLIAAFQPVPLLISTVLLYFEYQHDSQHSTVTQEQQNQKRTQQGEEFDASDFKVN